MSSRTSCTKGSLSMGMTQSAGALCRLVTEGSFRPKIFWTRCSVRAVCYHSCLSCLACLLLALLVISALARSTLVAYFQLACQLSMLLLLLRVRRSYVIGADDICNRDGCDREGRPFPPSASKCDASLAHPGCSEHTLDKVRPANIVPFTWQASRFSMSESFFS